MAGKVQTGQLSGSFARRPSRCSFIEAAGSGTLCGAGEEGHGDSQEFPAYDGSDSSSDDSETPSSREDEEEEEETSPPPAGGGKKMKAAPVGGGRRVQEEENPSAGLRPRRRRGRRGVAGQGQASGEIVSVQIPE